MRRRRIGDIAAVPFDDEGNVTDSLTLLPEVKRVREDFGIEQLVMVGDRGMISSKAIAELRESDGVAWITALKSVSIRALVEQGQLQLDLFDERNLLELSSPDYPGERLVACRNPELARLRTHKREELLAATEANLAKIKARVDAGKLTGRDEIGLRVGKVINQYKVAKHFELAIGENTFTFARKREASPPKRRWMASTSSALRCRPHRWIRPTACATTSRWPTSSVRSARSRRST